MYVGDGDGDGGVNRIVFLQNSGVLHESTAPDQTMVRRWR